jgi:hypothetical protein|tara:strand:- start:267 stop:467 length:201 start_codon:yes stop_codon:yes gene_type:complete
MGIMATLAMEYVLSPLGQFLTDSANGFRMFFEVAGRARAASELTRLGYHKEAKKLMTEVARLRGEK